MSPLETLSAEQPIQCVVAIPAHNEADLLPQCLAALAVQRDRLGAPLVAGVFTVVVLANNCSDATVEIAARLAPSLPFALHVIDVELPPEMASAGGGARKAAMDEAALLLAAGGAGGAILTTDADTMVASTWVANTLDALAAGADAVAGYVEPDPIDYLALGPSFMARGRLEDIYVRLRDEICAILDPVVHDPWPNHRVAAGASLAVSLQAYVEVGGVPLRSVGEDAALVRQLERHGKVVRHTFDVRVTTSCRLMGRASSGAAATMKARFENVDAKCDDDMEPAFATARKALLKGRLRRWHAKDGSCETCPAPFLVQHNEPFVELWDAVEQHLGQLEPPTALTPRDLPRQIEIAGRLLARLRRRRSDKLPYRVETADTDARPEPALSPA